MRGKNFAISGNQAHALTYLHRFFKKSAFLSKWLPHADTHVERDVVLVGIWFCALVQKLFLNHVGALKDFFGAFEYRNDVIKAPGANFFSFKS